MHFKMCRRILLKSLISPHFNNTIILTDSFCTMNTDDQIHMYCDLNKQQFM